MAPLAWSELNTLHCTEIPYSKFKSLLKRPFCIVNSSPTKLPTCDNLSQYQVHTLKYT